MNPVFYGKRRLYFRMIDWKLVLFKAQAANLKLVLFKAAGRKLVLFKAQAANLRLTTPKAFTLTLGILGTLAHFRHFLLLLTKDAAQHGSWTFCEAVKDLFGSYTVTSCLKQP